MTEPVNFSLDRTKRFRSAANFKRVFDSAEIKVGSSSLLILASSNQLVHPRLGMVVGKKNVRKAACRNLIKRHIRETFRLQQSDLAGLDVVVLARRGLGEMDNTELQEMLIRQWSKLANRWQEKNRLAQ